MKKNDKKIDQALSQALTQVCEKALIEYEGFSWITHTVNYKNFPQSLRITCIFNDDEDLHQLQNTEDSAQLSALISQELSQINIHLKRPNKHIFVDSEQRCEREHQGNWKLRLSQH
ncbi:MAG: hypothetical protein KAG18_07775 [Sinobacterium sp.]|nr:hypothetical protein [Sinobacterium sp.]